MPDDQKQDKFKGLGGTFRLDTTVPQVSSTEGAPAQVRQPIPAPAPSPNKIEDIREATNPDEAAKRIGEGFEGTVTGGLKMLGDLVLPPGKTEGERLKYLGKKYVTGPLNAAAAEALKQGPGIQQAATVGEALPGVGPLAVAPVVEPIKAASKSPTAALTTSQNLAGQAGAITLLAPAFEGAKAGAEGVVSGLGETAQTALGAAGEEVGNMARETAPEGSTEAGRVKLNVKGNAEPVKVSAEPAKNVEPTLEHKENVEDVPGAPMNRVVLKQGDKEMGRLNYVINGDTAAVKTVGVEPPLRGKGYAQQMYIRAADEIKVAHPEVKTLTSDLQGSTNEKATGVWDSLANQGHPIEKIASTKKGSSAYSWDLTKPQGAPKPALKASMEGLKKPGRDFSQYSVPSNFLKAPLEGLSKPGAKIKK